MIRKIVHIDEGKCTGCGLCANACHECAIEMVDGKAKLIKDDYCDGFGDCLPECPANAIEIIEREAAAYDHEAVALRMEAAKKAKEAANASVNVAPAPFSLSEAPVKTQSELRNWPVQIQLVPIFAKCFDGADLLIAADCTAYAYADFHRDFVKGNTVLIGCPKLDHANYQEKLAAILSSHNVNSLTVVRMEVPCCGGMAYAASEALKSSGKNIPFKVVTISTEGEIL